MTDDIVTLFLSFAIATAILLAPLFVAKQLVPGSYHFVQRLIRRISKSVARFVAKVLVLNQAKKRGLAFSLGVHFLFICALAMVVIGILTGTIVAIMAGVLCAAVATMVRHALATLHSLRSRRSRMPGRRRR